MFIKMFMKMFMNSYCSWKSRVGGKHGNGSLGTLAVPLDPTFT